MEGNPNDRSDDSAPRGRSDRWEAWVPGDPDEALTVAGLTQLARYVSVDSVERLSNWLAIPEAHQIQEDEGVAGLVEAIYGSFLRWRRPYNTQPWVPPRGGFSQRIRDPEWINRDSGTCIDLALVFSTSCVRHKLRPLVAIFPADDQHPEGHAVVLVPTDNPAGFEGFPPLKQGERVLTFPSAFAVLRWIETGQLVPVDPTLATRQRQIGFEPMVGATQDLFDSDRSVSLVDVRGVLDDGTVDGYGVPDPTQQPSIGTVLPAMPAYEEIPEELSSEASHESLSHQQILNRLGGPGGLGLTVLAGPQGVGKSRLAHRAIEMRDDGCGWFLTATNASTLIESLANAELIESGGDPSELNGADRQAFAKLALARLHDSGAPWAVVIDNAGAPQAPLLKWLPRPDARRGQQVIVTTTEDHRDAWLDADIGVTQVHDVPLLAHAQVDELLPDLDERGVALVNGRFLLVRALRAYAKQAHRLPDLPPTLATNADPGAAWIWQAVLEQLGPSRSLGHAAAVVAQLCPTPVPASAAADLGIVDELKDLERFGICERAGTDTTVHRLFAEAIRSQQGIKNVAESTIAMLSVGSVVDTVQRRLESETLVQLVRGVETTEARDERFGRALHSIASIQEHHSKVGDSAVSYERAQPLLQDAGLDLLVADCYFGRARWCNQKPPAETARLEEALTWVQTARTIHLEALDRGAQQAEPAGPARCRALEGLLLAKIAEREPDLVRRRDMLTEALEIVIQSERERREILGEGTPETEYRRATEIARSEFNLAGRLLGLAKLDSEDAARATLVRAHDVYARVRETRLSDLELPERHPHVAACDYGMGLIRFYMAALLTKEAKEQRVEWLRQADEDSRRSLASRQDLDGTSDGNDTLKSLRLLTKIALARLAVDEQAAIDAGDEVGEPFDQFLADSQQELADAGWGRIEQSKVLRFKQ